MLKSETNSHKGDNNNNNDDRPKRKLRKSSEVSKLHYIVTDDIKVIKKVCWYHFTCGKTHQWERC